MSIDNILYKLNQLEHYYNTSVLTHGARLPVVSDVSFTPSLLTHEKASKLSDLRKLVSNSKNRIQEQEDENENTEDQESSDSQLDIPETDENENNLDSKNLGRVYELKKIYSRLTSLESYLTSEAASVLLKLRLFVSRAIEMFEVIISNFSSFSDQIDEIIVIYYKFLKKIYSIVRDYYRVNNKKA